MLWWCCSIATAGESPELWAPKTPEPVAAEALAKLAVAPLLVRDGQDLSPHALRAALVQRAIALGWPVEGGSDEVFGQGESPARYTLGGSVEAVYDTVWHKDPGTGMDVRWELRDQALGSVVYRVTTRGFAANGGGQDALRAFGSAVDSLLSRELFAAVALREVTGALLSMPPCASTVAPSETIVSVESGAALGWGGIVSPSGHVWTSAQVVSGARAQGSQVWVSLPGGLRLEAEVLAENTERDIAALRVPGASFPCRPPDGRAAVGSPVQVGSPQGLLDGVISAERTFDGVQLLQITGEAAAPRGAPVFDRQGSLVGLVTGLPAQGALSFVLPAPTALEALRAHIGAEIKDLPQPKLVIDTPDPSIEPLVAKVCLVRTSAGPIAQYRVGRFRVALDRDEAVCLDVPKGSYEVGRSEGGVPVQVTVKDGDSVYVRALKAGLSLSNAHTYRKLIERGDVTEVAPSER